jgi:hypothetical protein
MGPHLVLILVHLCAITIHLHLSIEKIVKVDRLMIILMIAQAAPFSQVTICIAEALISYAKSHALFKSKVKTLFKPNKTPVPQRRQKVSKASSPSGTINNRSWSWIFDTQNRRGHSQSRPCSWGDWCQWRHRSRFQCAPAKCC